MMIGRLMNIKVDSSCNSPGNKDEIKSIFTKSSFPGQVIVNTRLCIATWEF